MVKPIASGQQNCQNCIFQIRSLQRDNQTRILRRKIVDHETEHTRKESSRK